MQRPMKRQIAETPAGAAHGAEGTVATTAAAAAGSPAPPIAGLPPSVLRHLLGLLSLGFRLKTCSLVHSTWAAAAAEATTAIKMPRNLWRQQHFNSAAAWLRRHASPTTLHTLVVEEWPWASVTDAFTPPLQQLRGLRVLKLSCCTLSAGSFRELSSLTALTDLGLLDVRCSISTSQLATCSKASTQQAAAAQPAATAQAAARLAAAADLSHALQHLPALVSLSLQGASARVLLPGPTAGTTGRLSTVLAGLTRLTSLTLIETWDVFPGQAFDISSSSELPDLLAGLGRLSFLHTLNLSGTSREGSAAPSGQLFYLQAATSCAGLLASTSLTSLHIKDITLPEGCGPHMFGRPGLRLPHLAEIYLEGVEQPSWGGSGYTPRSYLTADDVASIATCCEGGCLRSLTLNAVVEPGADFGSLSVLTTLTELFLSGSSTKGIDKLVSLQQLDLRGGKLKDATLAGMALQLTRLTYFSQWGVQLSERAAQSKLIDDLNKDIGYGASFGDEAGVCGELAGVLREAGILPRAR